MSKLSDLRELLDEMPGLAKAAALGAGVDPRSADIIKNTLRKLADSALKSEV